MNKNLLINQVIKNSIEAKKKIMVQAMAREGDILIGHIICEIVEKSIFLKQ